MQPVSDERTGSEPFCAERIGFARLTAMAFNGVDLRPLQDELIAKVVDGTAGPGDGLDLSLIAQLLGDKSTGLAIQAEVLDFHQLFRSPCASAQPRLRVLALAAAIDMGGNTPIEFLLEESGIELRTLYVIPGIELPSPLPEHDVAIVIASDCHECHEALRIIDEMAPHWPRPLLNPPRASATSIATNCIACLQGIEGLDIPATIGVTSGATRGRGARWSLARRHRGRTAVSADHPAARFACRRRVSPRSTIGPRSADISRNGPRPEFFVSRFVDYANEDGLFRKYPRRVRRRQALRLPHGDRRSLGYLVPQRRNVR